MAVPLQGDTAREKVNSQQFSRAESRYLGAVGKACLVPRRLQSEYLIVPFLKATLRSVSGSGKS